MATYYVDANNTTGTASDSNNGQSVTTAWLTLDKVETTGVCTFGTGTAGTTLYLRGTFRENLKIKPVNYLTIAQWPGAETYVIRGDTFPTWAGAAGVYTTTLAASGTTDGTASAISDYVASVVYNWDASIDAKGRHYGHLQRAANAAACTAGTYLYFYEPTTRLLTIGIGATDNPALCAWCKGNCHGIELGTPNYDHYPTGGTYSDDNRSIGVTIDGGHIYLWCDSGFGNRGSTISVGHGIRVADGINCTVRNVTYIDNGYHQQTFAGECCYGNLIEDCVMYGGAPNSDSGNTSFVFYTGPLGGLLYGNVDKCIARRLRIYKYWFLGVDGNPLALDAARVDMTTGSCDGIICHTNGRGVTTGNGTAGADGDTVTGSTNRVTCAAADGMYDNEPIYIVDSTASGLTAGATLYVNRVSGTLFTLSLTPGGAVIDAGDGAIHWYSLNNVVKDALFEDVYVEESGKISDNTMCQGQAAVGGNTTLAPIDPLDWSKYGVRYDRLTLVNCSRNSMSLASQVAYRHSHFGMDRAGQGSSRSTGAFVGGAMGADSNDTVILGRMLFDGCEFVFDLADPARVSHASFAGSSASALFQCSAATRLYFISPSFNDRTIRHRGVPSGVGTAGANGDSALDTDVISVFSHNAMVNGEAVTVVDSTATGLTAGTRYVRDVSGSMFKLASTFGGAAINITVSGAIHWYAQGINAIFNGPGAQTTSVIYVRGGVFVFRDPRGNNMNYLTYGLSSAWTRTANCDFLNCWYVNVSTGSYNPFDGGTDTNTAALWTTHVDTAAVHVNDTANLLYNPFLDPTGADLRLTKAGYSRTHADTVHAQFGINKIGAKQRRYAGNYGANQYGPVDADGRMTRGWGIR